MNFSFRCAVLQILNGSAIFHRVATAGEMQQLEAILFTQLNEAIDQFFCRLLNWSLPSGKLPA